MNKLIPIIAAALAVPCAAAAFQLDFNNGIPPEVKLYDLDGLTPAPDLDFTGLKAGVAWTACDVEKTGQRVAVSASWYKPAGRANDWMVLPAVDVTADTELRWTARAFDSQMPDGYSVYVSTTRDTPEDFDTAKPLFRIGGESAQWTDHSISLADYAGQSVNIAFVNDSEDCNMLLLRSVTADAPEKLIVNFAGERAIAEAGAQIPLKFKVSTRLNSAQTLTGAGCTVDDKDYSLANLGVLEPGKEVEFEFPATFGVEAKELSQVTVWVESDLGRIEKAFWFGNSDRKLVVEEATGTWCGFCVSGIYVLETIKSKYPGHTICIAVHENDPMAIDGYKVKGSGNPRLSLNREGSEMHPLDLEEVLRTHLSDLPRVVVEGEWFITDDQINVNASALFGEKSESLYRIAFVLVENDVHVPDDVDYAQKNSYSGGGYGPLGGFESLPNPILPVDMWYQEVARGIYPSQQGLPCSSGALLPIGEKTEVSYSFNVPSNVLKRDNLEVYILVMDAATTQVMNACVATRTSGAGTILPGVEPAGEPVSVEWFDISGRQVVNPSRGVYIRVARYADGTVSTSKRAIATR